MRKLAILSVTATLLLAFVQLPAQEVNKNVIKSEIKETKQEIKTDRKELRKLEGTSVNEITKGNFVSDFGKYPNVKWTRGDFMNEATFIKNGKEMKAYYDSDSKLIGTVSIKTISDLPIKAQNKIKTNYKEFAVQKVIFFDDNEGNDTDMIIYDTQFEDVDCYFVELNKENQQTILQVSKDGEVTLFKKS